MQHEELVVLLADTETHIDDCVEVEIPALTLHKGDIGHPTLVIRNKLGTSLENTAILENVLVLSTLGRR